MELTFVDDTYCLTLASRNALGSYEMYRGIDTEHSLHCSRKSLFHRSDSADGIGELLGIHLNVYVEGIVISYAVNDDLIVRLIALVEKDGLDLAGEYVYAADNKHIVASSHGL